MWDTIKDVAPVVSDVATALAFGAVAFQLWLIRRQIGIDAHFNFLKSEREIWLGALEHENIAPSIVEATWSHTPGGRPRDELFLIILTDNWWHAYVRYKDGQTPHRSWAPFEKYIVETLSGELANSIWASIKTLYPDDFVMHFDRLLQPPSVAQPTSAA